MIVYCYSVTSIRTDVLRVDVRLRLSSPQVDAVLRVDQWLGVMLTVATADALPQLHAEDRADKAVALQRLLFGEENDGAKKAKAASNVKK